MISNRRMQVIRSLVAGLLVALASGMARGQSASSVIDGAGMFSEDAVRKAKTEIARIERERGVGVTIETVTSLKGETIDAAALDHARRLGHRGIFVFIAEKEHTAEALAAPRSLFEELGKARLNEVRDAFTAEFRKSQIDEGLRKGVQAAEKALATVKRPIPTTPSPAPTQSGGGFLPTTPITAGGSSAGDSPLVLRQQVRLTLAGAKKAIEGAEAKAGQAGWKMNIAVVDDGGHLIAFERMDGARPASVATATTKAVSAATYRRPTGTFGPSGSGPDFALDISIQNASGGKVTTLLGGLPIIVDGQVIGAIGVGGGSGEQDTETAKAGLAAFLDGLKPKPEEPKEKPKEAEATPKRKDQEIEAATGKAAEPAGDPK